MLIEPEEQIRSVSIEWKEVHPMRSKCIRLIEEIKGMKPDEKIRLKKVTEMFPFLSNSYYLDLIDWDDPLDPIRKIIIPSLSEIRTGGTFDPSNESKYTVVKGLEHKYGPTALLLVSGACGGICRFCFRKRLFQDGNLDAIPDLGEAYKYIENHKEINNVLLSGGDPLFLRTEHLEKIVEKLLRMDHIRFIRIGTKMPAYDPERIIDDDRLKNIIGKIVETGRMCYIITDINHPRELTPLSKASLKYLRRSGASISNQTPLLRGVNDDWRTLKDLLNDLTTIGVSPYYIFQCRPTKGNRHFSVPIEEGYNIIEEARGRVSGLAKRVRYIMSHSTGKLEILGITEQRVFFKYQNAADEFDIGRILVFGRNSKAHWLEDYGHPIKSIPLGIKERAIEFDEINHEGGPSEKGDTLISGNQA